MKPRIKSHYVRATESTVHEPVLLKQNSLKTIQEEYLKCFIQINMSADTCSIRRTGIQTEHDYTSSVFYSSRKEKPIQRNAFFC